MNIITRGTGKRTKVVTVTGHRPQHLDGDFTLTSPLWSWIAARMDMCLVRATHLRCGMAVGVDLLAAERAYLLGVPYTAYVPFEGQAEKWPHESKIRYARVLSRASSCVMVNEGGYAAWKLHARNQAMLTGTAREDAEPFPDCLLAVWDGRGSGGTYQMTLLARKLGVSIERIDPRQVPT